MESHFWRGAADKSKKAKPDVPRGPDAASWGPSALKVVGRLYLKVIAISHTRHILLAGAYLMVNK